MNAISWSNFSLSCSCSFPRHLGNTLPKKNTCYPPKTWDIQQFLLACVLLRISPLFFDPFFPMRFFHFVFQNRPWEPQLHLTWCCLLISTDDCNGCDLEVKPRILRGCRLEIHRDPKVRAVFAKLADSGDSSIGKIHIQHVHIWQIQTPLDIQSNTSNMAYTGLKIYVYIHICTST